MNKILLLCSSIFVLTACNKHITIKGKDYLKNEISDCFNIDFEYYKENYQPICPEITQGSYLRKKEFIDYISPDEVYKYYLNKNEVEFDSLVVLIPLHVGFYAVNEYDDIPPNYYFITHKNGEIRDSYTYRIENGEIQNFIKFKYNPILYYFKYLNLVDSCHQDMMIKMIISKSNKLMNIEFVFNPDRLMFKHEDLKLIPEEYIEKYSLDEYWEN